MSRGRAGGALWETLTNQIAAPPPPHTHTYTPRPVCGGCSKYVGRPRGDDVRSAWPSSRAALVTGKQPCWIRTDEMLRSSDGWQDLSRSPEGGLLQKTLKLLSPAHCQLSSLQLTVLTGPGGATNTSGGGSPRFSTLSQGSAKFSCALETERVFQQRGYDN